MIRNIKKSSHITPGAILAGNVNPLGGDVPSEWDQQCI